MGLNGGGLKSGGRIARIARIARIDESGGVSEVYSQYP